AYFCSTDNTLVRIDPLTGKPLGPPLLKDQVVHVLALSPDGKLLVAGSTGKDSFTNAALGIWDAVSGNRLAGPIEKSPLGPIIFSPDSNSFFIAGSAFKENPTLYDAHTGKPVGAALQVQGVFKAHAGAFRTDGKLLAVAGGVTEGTSVRFF